MKERPILFSGPMVRAILAGRKTQTRRVVADLNPTLAESAASGSQIANALRCPYGAPGDRLWVRETWAAQRALDKLPPQMIEAGAWVEYAAGPGGGILDRGKWRPSIFMPRWASRILLEVTAVRVERLQDISETDAEAEGVDAVSMADVPRQATMNRRADFKQLWDSINAKRAPWASNPWVWVVEFKRLDTAAFGEVRA
jgi:hypothetical protein